MRRHPFLIHGDVTVKNAAGDETLATFAANGPVTLYYDNTAVFETVANGGRFMANAAVAQLKDTGGSATDMEAWVSLADGAGTERGWFGFGEANTTFRLKNNIGSVVLATSGGTATLSTAPVFIVSDGTNASAFAPTYAAVDAQDTNTADFRMMQGGVNRWIFRKDGTTEGGSNTGSDFGIVARADDGSSLGNCLTINRATRYVTVTIRLNTPASSTTVAGFNVPHGAAPTSPSDGDIWTTTAGLYVRINGSTVGPLS